MSLPYGQPIFLPRVGHGCLRLLAVFDAIVPAGAFRAMPKPCDNGDLRRIAPRDAGAAAMSLPPDQPILLERAAQGRLWWLPESHAIAPAAADRVMPTPCDNGDLRRIAPEMQGVPQ